ncbi:sensor histidine kinase [Roseburia sp. MSJ-14]|uniref:sensor histidine kinase n=1 Tax=Roseburia sp. MSJ-14 TaxID=2841514 RepID=UPI001C1224C0|nr:sensor histidine kinase [Roseburia sp. MSJ-14]MBU5474682.1 sensor histidine kinase [Roseburia sp. MSJ-14]
MWWIKSYMRRHRLGILLFLLFGAICAAVLFLYRLPMEAIGYAFALCLVIGVIAVLVDASAYRKKVQKLLEQQEAVKNGTEELPSATDSLEEAYQELIYLAQEERRERTAQLMREKKDITDYFTLWAHQIKTPIAAMRLLFQQETENIEQFYEQRKECEGELFKIEQYVEMVLQYLRLNSSVNDFVLQEYSLDSIIRQAIHKYAPMFIRKKLALHYETITTKVVTDEKWMVFVVEQIFSNAIKYTVEGSISIYMEGGNLVIADTGIGILPEDLPRVFEKGYTGYNGRNDKKASGIGLYLCKQILEKLGHKVYVTSEPGKGTKMKLVF